jgi:hypothetical protein
MYHSSRWHDVKSCMPVLTGRRLVCTCHWAVAEDGTLQDSSRMKRGNNWTLITSPVQVERKSKWREKWWNYLDPNRSQDNGGGRTRYFHQGVYFGTGRSSLPLTNDERRIQGSKYNMYRELSHRFSYIMGLI